MRTIITMTATAVLAGLTGAFLQFSTNEDAMAEALRDVKSGFCEQSPDSLATITGSVQTPLAANCTAYHLGRASASRELAQPVAEMVAER